MVSEGIREARFSALVYCKCREGFHNPPRRRLQTINMPHFEGDVAARGEVVPRMSCLMPSVCLINTWKDQVWSVLFSKNVIYIERSRKTEISEYVNVHNILPVQRVQHETCRGSSAAAGVSPGSGPDRRPLCKTDINVAHSWQKNRPLMLQVNRFVLF